MASLNPIRNAKKQTIRVDMAPMVDLALLLVIFFMVTLSLNRPKVLLLTMPATRTDEMGIIEHGCTNITTTLILEEENRIFCYHGVEEPTVSVTNYSPGGLRRILRERLANAVYLGGYAFFIIKPTDKATYQNVVDVLDEIKITGASVYTLGEIEPQDKQLIEDYKTQQSAGS